MYTGSVGNDVLAEQLKEANKREGLTDVYMVKNSEKTGACAVVITGHYRYVSVPFTFVLVPSITLRADHL